MTKIDMTALKSLKGGLCGYTPPAPPAPPCGGHDGGGGHGGGGGCKKSGKGC